MFEHILCPIDGSPGSLAALDVAARFAGEQHAKLTICSIVDPTHAATMAFGYPSLSAACYEALDEEAKAFVGDAAARVTAYIAAETVTLMGQPVAGIVDCAASIGADLIAMGSHGRGGLAHALLGSVAEGVLRHAGVPVLVIRQPARVKDASRAQIEPGSRVAENANLA